MFLLDVQNIQTENLSNYPDDDFIKGVQKMSCQTVSGGYMNHNKETSSYKNMSGNLCFLKII